MARVKRAVNAQKKRRTTLEAASGYRGQRSRLYRKAKEQLLHSATYAYRDRKVLAELAVNEPAAFAALVETARAAVAAAPNQTGVAAA